MKKYITLFFLLVSTLSSAQNLKKVKEKLENGKAIYHVLKSDNSIKHGEYILQNFTNKKNILKGNYFKGKKEGVWSEFYKSNGSLKIQGRYRGGVKAGEWVYYGRKGKVVQIYNFDEATLVWTTECETKRKYDVLVNDEFIKSKLDCLPTCIGGLEQLQDDFSSFMKRAIPLRIKSAFTVSEFSVTISKEGILKNIEFLDKRLKNETIKKTVKTYFDNNQRQWFPGSLNNMPIESKIKLLFPVNLNNFE